MKCVVVVGVGYIGVELVGVLYVFGIELYLVVCKYVLFRNFDFIIYEILVDMIYVEGCKLYDYVSVEKVEKVEDGELLVYLINGEVLKVDCLIWVIGCKFFIDKIDIENIDVELNDNGMVKVDKY